MKQETIESMRGYLVANYGAMPGEAEIMATAADNNLPAGTSFADALEYVKTHFQI
jgi:hypothetical protein